MGSANWGYSDSERDLDINLKARGSAGNNLLDLSTGEVRSIGVGY